MEGWGDESSDSPRRLYLYCMGMASLLLGDAEIPDSPIGSLTLSECGGGGASSLPGSVEVLSPLMVSTDANVERTLKTLSSLLDLY